ncbi:hypothetical protein [Streptomyces sp. NPDC058398]|uniref:hypothetical protein n=1 Tax=Streptomyces sp. NPDC058398 TaxID=3346479 RepID=UPI00365AF229
MASISTRSAATVADRAAADWLLDAADSAVRACIEWDKYGLALLQCGRIFAAVRISGRLVFAAAGTEELPAVEEYLAEMLRGPVFMDLYPHRYYALIPPQADIRSESARGRRGREVAFLDGATFMGVPHPCVRAPVDAISMHWCVSLDPSGDLCAPDRVNQMISFARHRLLERRAEVAR